MLHSEEFNSYPFSLFFIDSSTHCTSDRKHSHNKCFIFYRFSGFSLVFAALSRFEQVIQPSASIWKLCRTIQSWFTNFLPIFTRFLQSFISFSSFLSIFNHFLSMFHHDLSIFNHFWWFQLVFDHYLLIFDHFFYKLCLILIICAVDSAISFIPVQYFRFLEHFNIANKSQFWLVSIIHFQFPIVLFVISVDKLRNCKSSAKPTNWLTLRWGSSVHGTHFRYQIHDEIISDINCHNFHSIAIVINELSPTNTLIILWGPVTINRDTIPGFWPLHCVQ